MKFRRKPLLVLRLWVDLCCLLALAYSATGWGKNGLALRSSSVMERKCQSMRARSGHRHLLSTQHVTPKMDTGWNYRPNPLIILSSWTTPKVKKVPKIRKTLSAQNMMIQQTYWTFHNKRAIRRRAIRRRRASNRYLMNKLIKTFKICFTNEEELKMDGLLCFLL